MKAYVYQIFYSEQTRVDNDQGFLQLDNMTNERPDWREYWPIRNFLLSNTLDEEAYYGFFSPKFKSKTNLGSDDVYRFIASSDADVILFSPFFDQSAFALNVFEQAAIQHHGISPVLDASFKVLAPEVNINQLVMSSRDTVFCNYFVAKKPFWETWLAHCEAIYALAERGDTLLAEQLNDSTNHDGGQAPTKVFVIERIVSFLLAISKGWDVHVLNPIPLPCAAPALSQYIPQLCELDALKIAFSVHQFPEYITAFNKKRIALIEDIQSKRQ
jgi:hypothetical protein